MSRANLHHGGSAETPEICLETRTVQYLTGDLSEKQISYDISVNAQQLKKMT